MTKTRARAAWACIGLLCLLATPHHSVAGDIDLLETAVADALVKSKGTLAKQAYQVATVASLEPLVEPRDVSSDGAWSFGGAVMLVPQGVDAPPIASLYIAERTGKVWRVHLDGSKAFARAAARAPLELFHDQAEQRALSAPPRAVEKSSHPGMVLPWQQSGGNWRHWGVHGNAGTDRPYNAIDFYGGDGLIRASAGGYLYRFCGSTTPLLQVRHGAGWTTGYYHLTQQTNAPSGSFVDRYAPLGRIGEQLPCGGRANGAHVHWTLWRNGLAVPVHGQVLGGWTWYEQGWAYRGWAQRGSAQIYNGWCCLRNFGPGFAEITGRAHNPGGVVNVRSGPGSGFAAIRAVDHDQRVPLICQVRGARMTGPWGNVSDVWNRLEDGRFISDAWLDPGSKIAVVPVCG